MGLQRDPQVEVAGRTAVATRSALPGKANQLAVAHSGGEVDVDLTVIERQPAASSLQRVLQRQLEQRLAVVASQRPAGRAAPAPPPPTSEQPLEQVVAELHPGVVTAEPLAGEELLEVRVRRCLLLLAPVGAEAVVALALVRIGQHLVRLAELLETVLRVAVGVEVGVVACGRACGRRGGSRPDPRHAARQAPRSSPCRPAPSGLNPGASERRMICRVPPAFTAATAVRGEPP